jgi:superfamily I DNA and/or RNA helicase
LLDGAARVGALESILTLCEARGLGSRMLEWHYRSRDPSLIRVSNREFYKDGLILPPSPLQNDPAYGLAFTRVAGAYDRSGKRDNRLEGAAIVKRVVEHAAATPSFSLGIVTFSSAQRNLITELLEYERRQDRTLDEFLREGGSEDVFVKNIENVQGDERDVILVSVGYGPTEPGARLTNMNFGPVNGEGGERRLNVLFTRARLRCEVFASFDPGDIDLTKVSKEGPRVLKRFLEFAKTGLMADKVATGADPDTPFERDHGPRI